MERNRWMARGFASVLLTAAPLGFLLADDSADGPALIVVGNADAPAPTAKPAAPRPLPSETVAPPEARKPSTLPSPANDPVSIRSGVIKPRGTSRLTDAENRGVASALATADTLNHSAVAASIRGELSVDGFALQQDLILAIRRAAADLRLDSAARLHAVQSHASALRGLCDRLERRATSSDPTMTADLTAARAYASEADALLMDEAGEAASLKRAWNRTADVTEDLLSIRLQDARRGSTSLESLAHAVNLAVRVGARAAAVDATFEPSKRLGPSLDAVARLADARSSRSQTVADDFGRTLVEIEISRAKMLWKTAKGPDGKSVSPRFSEAERLSDSLFRQQTDVAGASAERAQRAADLWQRRDEFHDRLAGPTGQVSQVLRNENTSNLARLNRLAARLGENGTARKPETTALRPGTHLTPSSNVASHLEALAARASLRTIDRRLTADRLAGRTVTPSRAR